MRRSAAPVLEKLVRESTEPAAAINALHTLDALSKLTPQLIQESLQHADSGVRRQTLVLAKTRTADQRLIEAMTQLAGDPEPIVRLTGWQAVGIAPRPPADWTVMTRDLWQDFGDFTLTGIAPTAIAGPALFDGIELLRSLDE